MCSRPCRQPGDGCRQPSHPPLLGTELEVPGGIPYLYPPAEAIGTRMGGPAVQLADPPAGMDGHDPMGAVADFAGTAAPLLRLDLVIAVDSSAATLPCRRNRQEPPTIRQLRGRPVDDAAVIATLTSTGDIDDQHFDRHRRQPRSWPQYRHRHRASRR
ncbi:hypothetical protein ABMY26_04210 [Azospirillum sp. HJ39]|uniref:hypothetical protein n=1 Tax=Azospirillum sp. HJ39 TaxID=3159496 RepID=UPI0035590234